MLLPTDVIPVRQEWAQRTWITAPLYAELYQRSLEDPEGFWAEQARSLTWIKPFTRVKDTSFAPEDVHIRWFEDGTLNVSVNCIDRHLPLRAEQPALIWEPDTAGPSRIISYQELSEEVNRFANVLKKMGVQKGDRVTLSLPMIPEAAFAMLACARIGAIHSVVFGGFSSHALAGRIADCVSDFVITADAGVRGGRRLPLKENVDAALADLSGVRHVLVIRHAGGEVPFTPGRDVWYHEVAADVAAFCPPVEMNAEDPLFILYTSGSTGKPKGVLHTTAGYLLYASLTHKYVFDVHEEDVFWCTADLGWITGHSYALYGPLANGGRTVLFEGLPTFPTPSRFWEIIDKYKVSIFYTAPTALRSLMAQGDAYVTQTSRSSLRILGSVGEPINPEAWYWYFTVVGEGRCPIVDTWWQTETGGILITPLPGAMDLKPGAALRPFFGIKPQIMTQEGPMLEGPGEGVLVLAESWPGQMRTVYGDHQRFVQTYFAAYPGKYFTGDGCRRDAEGDYWITGRVDDVLNVSGHRLGTAELESALVAHPDVAEAAVVGCPHSIKGIGIYAYVTLMEGRNASEELTKALKESVRKEIGPVATPDYIHYAKSLPKTRSGKIMRRILRKIAEGETENLGDISTLADPEIVEDLVKNRQVENAS